ncbi:MAG: hypothetical protein KAY37_13280 [Phycisphaerae bacterium]|nr:hypothetical protein [Phycisphaerae bacterium]
MSFIRPFRAMSVGFFIVVLVLFSSSCRNHSGSTDETELRATVERVRTAAVNRDYEELWDYTSSISRADLAKQLRDFQTVGKNSPVYEHAAKAMKLFDINIDDLASMDVRSYFLALMKGLDHTELRDRQIEQTRRRQVTRIEWFDYYAIVHEKTPDGEVLATGFVKEGDTWKVRMDVGEGVSIELVMPESR